MALVTSPWGKTNWGTFGGAEKPAFVVSSIRWIGGLASSKGSKSGLDAGAAPNPPGMGWKGVGAGWVTLRGLAGAGSSPESVSGPEASASSCR